MIGMNDWLMCRGMRFSAFRIKLMGFRWLTVATWVKIASPVRLANITDVLLKRWIGGVNIHWNWYTRICAASFRLLHSEVVSIL